MRELEDLAISDFSIRAAPRSKTPRCPSRGKGTEARPGLLDMHREVRVRESVARDPSSDQQPSRAHARVDRLRLPAIARARREP